MPVGAHTDNHGARPPVEFQTPTELVGRLYEPVDQLGTVDFDLHATDGHVYEIVLSNRAARRYGQKLDRFARNHDLVTCRVLPMREPYDSRKLAGDGEPKLHQYFVNLVGIELVPVCVVGNPPFQGFGWQE